MGLADAMLRLKLMYGDSESLEFTSEVMEVLMNASYMESRALGEERGVPNECIKVGNATGDYRRNITTISIAPTGSIAFIAECSHGIEPIFSPSYIRVDERGEEYMFEHPLKNEPYFVSAVGHINAPSWESQIKLVAAVQEFCDSGISKTINMEENTTPKDVLDAYVLAWELGCKGITVYRNNSRKIQVLNHKEEKKIETSPVEFVEILKEEDSIDMSCPTGVCTL